MLLFWQAHLQMRPASLPRQGPVQPSPPISITESRVQRPKWAFVYIQQNAGGCDENSSFFRPRRAGGVTWGLWLCYHPPAPFVPRDESRAWGWTRPTHTASLWVTSTCQFYLPNMHTATSLLLPPPQPGSSRLPQPLGPDPPSSPHTVGHCLPWTPPSLACHPDTPLAPHWGLRDSPLPPRAPHSPPYPDTPLSTPRPCCSLHDGNVSAAALPSTVLTKLWCSPHIHLRLYVPFYPSVYLYLYFYILYL